MSTVSQKPIVITKSGHALIVAPGTENPVSATEMLRRRDAWLERNKEKVKGYTVADFIAEKHADVEKGLA